MQYLTIISNFIYLLCGGYLLYKKHYLYGILTIMMWLISHIYHCDNSNEVWNWKMNTDIIFAIILFIIILIKCHSIILCFNNICFLFVLLILFGLSYYYYYIDINKYYIFHSLWHVLSALFLLYIIILYHNNI
jgi:hypothetical protein